MVEILTSDCLLFDDEKRILLIMSDNDIEIEKEKINRLRIEIEIDRIEIDKTQVYHDRDDLRLILKRSFMRMGIEI